MKILDKLMGKISNLISFIGAGTLVLMMLVVVVDVLRRAITGRSIVGTMDITQVCFSVIVFCSIYYTQYTKGHVRVIVFVKALPKRFALLIVALGNVICSTCSVALTYSMTQYAIRLASVGTTTSTLKVPYYPFAMVASVLLGLFTILLVIETITMFYSLTDNEKTIQLLDSLG